MPAFGTTLAPVRSQYDLNVNYPDGMPSAFPPGPDTWYTGLHWWWEATLPPSVTRATAIITNPLCRMPWKIIKPDGTSLNPADDGYPAWLIDPQLIGGSSGGSNLGAFDMLDRHSRFDTFSKWIRDALWLGLGVLSYTPDADRQPKAGTVQVIAPTRLYRGEDGWALDVDGTPEPIDSQGMVLGQRLVLLRHALPGGVLGWHRASFRLSQKMTDYAARTFDTSQPSGILTTDQPLNQKQANDTREAWHNFDYAGMIRVLGNGAKYQPVVISPVDSELIAMAKQSNESIAHAFELPSWYLDASTNTMTYNNAGWFRQDLVDGPLASWSARIEQAISGLLPWGTRMEIDFTRYTQPIGSGVEGQTDGQDPAV